MTTAPDTVPDLEVELAKLKAWVHDDERDQWSAEIEAAHPSHSDDAADHERYGVAMEMVRVRRSKFGLVALINWLLKDRDTCFREWKNCYRDLAQSRTEAESLRSRVAELEGLVRDAVEALAPLADSLTVFPADLDDGDDEEREIYCERRDLKRAAAVRDRARALNQEGAGS